MRIMIVDDNELMRKEIFKSVAQQTDTVLECDDGETALSNCVDFKPDWILMDIRMKGMNGITAAKRIKEIIPDINIAFVTGYDNYSYRQEAKSLSIEHYFIKTNLLDIRKVLDRYKQ